MHFGRTPLHELPTLRCRMYIRGAQQRHVLRVKSTDTHQSQSFVKNIQEKESRDTVRGSIHNRESRYHPRPYGRHNSVFATTAATAAAMAVAVTVQPLQSRL